jgi:hypothetical protein
LKNAGGLSLCGARLALDLADTVVATPALEAGLGELGARRLAGVGRASASARRVLELGAKLALVAGVSERCAEAIAAPIAAGQSRGTLQVTFTIVAFDRCARGPASIHALLAWDAIAAVLPHGLALLRAKGRRTIGGHTNFEKFPTAHGALTRVSSGASGVPSAVLETVLTTWGQRIACDTQQAAVVPGGSGAQSAVVYTEGCPRT